MLYFVSKRILFVWSIVAIIRMKSAFAGGGGGGGGGGQWRTNGNGHGDFNSAAAAQPSRTAAGGRGTNFQAADPSNGWQKSGSFGGGGRGTPSQYSSNAYDNGDKYGYDYAIPGANVHFAAFRGAGRSSVSGDGGDGGGGGWNDFARKQSQGQQGQTGNGWQQKAFGKQGNDASGSWQNRNSQSWRNAGSGAGAGAAPSTW